MEFVYSLFLLCFFVLAFSFYGFILCGGCSGSDGWMDRMDGSDGWWNLGFCCSPSLLLSFFLLCVFVWFYSFALLVGCDFL
ncbi:hypothetical protein BZA05DRAFT_412358 [Tricharina praecox]|uniref:uncharacterized protein n=1 Tax=Tricharina praecox TaxID=43433 RepID=UPI0022204EAA|nr:uncharacterized protein BZA05DRAFT_412358 [Tricharina praecox]KAI5842326.1 hypothetical protein BZA05DRAFT_412358 [Tricharina praecox]